MIKEDKLNHLKRLYSSLVKDINNKINLQQMEMIIKNMGFHLDKEDIVKLITSSKKDSKGDDNNFNQFISLLTEKSKEIDFNIKEAFSTLDRDHNGYISIRELRHLFLCLGENYSINEVKSIFCEMEEDNDGYINYQDFLKIISEGL